MKLDLVYLSDNTYGGWMTFTRHLHDALQMLHKKDLTVRIVKVGDTCRDDLNFGYGLPYQRRTLNALMMEGSHKLIVALHKKYAEAARTILGHPFGDINAIVVHDHNEVKHLKGTYTSSSIVIRQANKDILPYTTYIPHPYVPTNNPSVPEDSAGRKVWARSVCRIDHDKNTHLLLLANRLLPEAKRIDIRGFDNRIYTRFTIMPKFPEYVQSKAHFPREKDFAVGLLQETKYMVDMSTIKGDGGGTQYTFLEAADAGACPVLNSQWCSIKGEMKPGVNCLVAANEKELAQVLTKTSERVRLAIVNEARRTLLPAHAPKKVAALYVRYMETL